VKNELKAYNPELAKKDEYLFLTKTDMVTPAEVKKKITILKKLNKNITPFSILDEESLKKVKEILNKIKDEKIEK
jgi:GTPase involved in cell partitioning and DNA repair